MSSENLDFSLSTYNLKDFPFHKYEKNFTFIVNGKEYKTNRFIADLLSPIIRNSHFNDETLDTFTFYTKNNLSKSDDKNDYFRDFLNLCQFETVNIDSNRRKIYCDYFCHLGNSEEYIRLRSDDTEEITKEDAVDQLIAITDFLSSNNIIKKAEYDSYKATVHKIITFIASNFDEIDKSKLKDLSFDVIEEIISNESLKLREEDNLLYFILDLYELDRDNSILFKYVIFSNINDDTFKHFIKKIEIDCLDENIWKSICNRVLSSKSDSQHIDKKINKSRYLENILEFQHQKGKEFQGIMHHLTEETGGNIHDNGTIKIDSNSLSKKNYHPKNLVDYEKDNFYYSNNDVLSQICFDFKDKKVNISEYSIKSYDQEAYTGHLKDWEIDVSNDGDNWNTIDSHENDQSLNGPNIIKTFNVQKKDDQFYRFVRFKQTGNNWNGRNCNFIYFYCIEFHGKLKKPIMKSSNLLF